MFYASNVSQTLKVRNSLTICCVLGEGPAVTSVSRSCWGQPAATWLASLYCTPQLSLSTQYTVAVGWTLLHLYPRHTIYSSCGLDTPTPLSSPHNIQLLWAGHSYTSILSTQYTVAVGWTLLHLYPLLTIYSCCGLDTPTPLSSPQNIQLLWA